jgi:flagellar basal-body rod modification protein FlgD
MSTINPLQSISSNQNSNSTVSGSIAAATPQFGMNEFLHLLITQLKNQDPMSPIDNQEFVTQMASFSSLEQLISINNAVTTIAGAPKDATDANGSGSQ